MKVEMAQNADDMKRKLQMWKSGVRLLLESPREQDIKMTETNDQMISILKPILLGTLAECWMTKYEVEEAKAALQVHLIEHCGTLETSQ